MLDWLTNDPEIAAKLKQIEHDYQVERGAVQHLSLNAKIAGYRLAAERRQQRIDRLFINFGLE